MARTDAGATPNRPPRKAKPKPAFTPVECMLPSGAKFTALSPAEASLVRDKVDRYARDFELTNISDIADIDTCVQFEVLVQRWNYFISRGLDYDDKPVAVLDLQKQVKDTQSSLLALKKQLGIDKATRDKTEGEGSTAQFIEDLLHRAHEFKINRDDMAAKAIELAMELIHLVTLYDNSTPEERMSVSIDIDGIMQWVREVFKPEFMAIDAHFRTHKQSMWIREQ